MAVCKLVYAVDMLHYLPLFMAHRFMGNEIALELAQPNGDLEAFSRLMSASPADQEVHFCVCDPMMINPAKAYGAGYDDYPVVVGQLVRKAPFWAIDHERPGFTDESGFGKYTYLYRYPHPNTGYVIGELARKRAGLHTALTCKPMPIDSKLETYLTDDISVALDADILKLSAYKLATGRDFVFNYPGHPDFNNFCFTALITRKKFLSDATGRLITARLIYSLQKSIWAIYAHHHYALQSALEHFGRKGYDSRIVGDALDQLRSDHVFPESLTTTPLSWEKSIRLQKEVAPDFIAPSFHKFVDNSIAAAEHERALHEVLDKRSHRLFIYRIRHINARPVILWIGAVIYTFGSLLLEGFESLKARFTHWDGRLWSLLHIAIIGIGVGIFLKRSSIANHFGKDLSEVFKQMFAVSVTIFGVDMGFLTEFYRIH